ncbi:L-aspartate oxidase [Cytobacillus purgationiresistens]|uniref:L-aspartate oxidase n=1 Tax=Cytobacillus purgationiresistens TaxID=863449 RepID=A0ABU0AF50_9BACI|nr:L-aspartate oxidase [Cytobacillus purgationiresistens]MDQ0269892.1 L-aspartate oxidase [Cytobacillus purgationiresistens]
MKQANVIIIGSGIAAMQLAKRLRHDMNVIILTKSTVSTSNSSLAQGGIAAAINKRDIPLKHYNDTLEAGRYHNDSAVVEAITRAAPSLIHELIVDGCEFDRDSEGRLLLGLEGAHSENRIVHCGGDATGKHVMEFLTADMPSNLEMIENLFVYELLVDEINKCCYGIKAKTAEGKIEMMLADHVVLATGGCGQLYSYTSNEDTVCGDGIALAYRAGAELTDMEFIQFHPTLLYIGGKTRGLVSEAVRGEGGFLVTDDGQSIMDGIHRLKDLAPRHIVSQTIYSYLKQEKQIYLDISKVKHFRRRFPTIAQLCEKNGVNLNSKLIPVVPGSHFLMGGIRSDMQGRTNIEGLYAIGEVACTGVHGANRLASNSLLEGLFFGRQLADYLNRQVQSAKGIQDRVIQLQAEAGQLLFCPTITEIKERMMDLVGIVRTEEGLLQQQKWLRQYEMNPFLSLDGLSIKDTQTYFMMITAGLITNAALMRTESRGGHYRTDYPKEQAGWQGKKMTQTIKRDGINEQIKIATST